MPGYPVKPGKKSWSRPGISNESVADQSEGELAQEQPQQKCDTPIKS